MDKEKECIVWTGLLPFPSVSFMHQAYLARWNNFVDLKIFVNEVCATAFKISVALKSGSLVVQGDNVEVTIIESDADIEIER